MNTNKPRDDIRAFNNIHDANVLSLSTPRWNIMWNVYIECMQVL